MSATKHALAKARVDTGFPKSLPPRRRGTCANVRRVERIPVHSIAMRSDAKGAPRRLHRLSGPVISKPHEPHGGGGGEAGLHAARRGVGARRALPRVINEISRSHYVEEKSYN